MAEFFRSTVSLGSDGNPNQFSLGFCNFPYTLDGHHDQGRLAGQIQDSMSI